MAQKSTVFQHSVENVISGRIQFVKLTACTVWPLKRDKSSTASHSLISCGQRFIGNARRLLTAVDVRSVHFRVSLFWSKFALKYVMITERVRVVAVTTGESAYVTIARWLVHHVETQMKRWLETGKPLMIWLITMDMGFCSWWLCVCVCEAR